MNNELITIGMASIPARQDGMLRVLRDLLPTCDHFDLYLNNYPGSFHADEFLDPKITVFRDMTDIGARGKLYLANRTGGYHLTVDDDLVYPPDYTYTMVQAIEKYKREAVVGGHGVLFGRSPDPMQPDPRILFSHQAHVPLDMLVHMLGTGVFAWHADTVDINWQEMEPGKIDEQVAILCQERRVPMICVAHRDEWVTEDDDLKYLGALRRNMEASEAAVARQQRPWDLFIPNSWKEYQKFP
jgi:hypothetical protein